MAIRVWPAEKTQGELG